MYNVKNFNFSNSHFYQRGIYIQQKEIKILIIKFNFKLIKLLESLFLLDILILCSRVEVKILLKQINILIYTNLSLIKNSENYGA